MKKAITIIIMFLCLQVQAQKHDYLWLFGINIVPVNTNDERFSITHIDFQSSPAFLYRSYRPLVMESASAAISDKDGRLQFYTDGFFINNYNNEQLPNGFGLNPGQVAIDYAGYSSTYPSGHGSMLIPKPGDDSIYYIFHTALKYDSFGPLLIYCDFLYSTVIDMRLNNGEVVEKNKSIIGDTLIGGGGMAACKHANGRDWWIIAQEMRTNCFYRFLLTPNGIGPVQKQCLGDTVHFSYGTGSNTFTPDGSKYIWSNAFENLNILDFDRCTGEFSNYIRIKVSDSLTATAGPSYLDGVAVSPNSRYLYLTTGSELRQFDLWNDSIEATEIIIDNTYQGSPKTSVLFCQLAPDGKIYVNPNLADTILHVINNPDLPGAACNFVRKGLSLLTYNGHYLPYYPNYRLGALTGSECDTIVSSINNVPVNHEDKLVLFPNPATDVITIDYGYTNWNKGEVQLQITNAIGQTVYNQTLPMYSGYQQLNVNHYPAGLYTAFIKRNGKTVAAQKWVKE